MLHWASPDAGMVGTMKDKARTRGKRKEEEKEDILGCTKRQKWPRPRRRRRKSLKERRKKGLSYSSPKSYPRVQAQGPDTPAR